MMLWERFSRKIRLVPEFEKKKIEDKVNKTKTWKTLSENKRRGG